MTLNLYVFSVLMMHWIEQNVDYCHIVTMKLHWENTENLDSYQQIFLSHKGSQIPLAMG